MEGMSVHSQVTGPCSVDSDPYISDRCTTPGQIDVWRCVGTELEGKDKLFAFSRCTTPGQCNVVTGGRWVGFNGEGECELSPFCWCCSGSGGKELRGVAEKSETI